MKKTLFVSVFAIALIFSVNAQVKTTAISLSSYYVNQMKVGGETGWFTEPNNPSTGYYWKYTPDNSGVYNMFEKVTLKPSPPAGYVGAPGRVIWKFKGIKKGMGSAMFQLFPPGKNMQPVRTVIVRFNVQ
ncbi:MAG: hypothetical protein GY940_12090 [bacterium]|nr:hypothetical protein [bacterium]